MEQAPGFPFVSNMANGNRSAKGKSVIVDDDYEIGSTSNHNQGSHGYFSSFYDSHSGSRAGAAIDRHDDGYSAHLLSTKFDNDMISTSSLHLTITPTYYQHVDLGYTTSQ